MDHGLTSTTLGGSTFTLASKYRPQRLVGSGSGGVVVAATCADSSNEVAIKKIHIERDLTIERHALAARRTLREISLISQLDHENVLGLLDLSCSGGGAADFDHLYLVTPLMDADLHRVIRSPQPLTEQHVQFFMWQLLRGLEHLHACAVVHRDLKPANLLVNANCDLKITDFGLARVIGGPAEEAPRDGLTSYVVTRWYRAPEVLVGAEYGRAVDVWSAGCILAEMLGRSPLFPGRDALEQLRLILRVAATLPGGSAERDHVPAAARVSLDRLAAEPAAPLDALYPRVSYLEVAGDDRWIYASSYTHNKPSARFEVEAVSPELLRSRVVWMLLMLCVAQPNQAAQIVRAWSISACPSCEFGLAPGPLVWRTFYVTERTVGVYCSN